MKNKILSVVVAGAMSVLASCTLGDFKALSGPVTFIAISEVIDKSDDKPKAIADIKEIAGNLRVLASVADSTLTKEQFIEIVGKTSIKQQYKYFAVSLYDLYAERLSKFTENEKVKASSVILKQIAQSLEDAANLAAAQK